MSSIICSFVQDCPHLYIVRRLEGLEGLEGMPAGECSMQHHQSNQHGDVSGFGFSVSFFYCVTKVTIKSVAMLFSLVLEPAAFGSAAACILIFASLVILTTSPCRVVTNPGWLVYEVYD